MKSQSQGHILYTIFFDYARAAWRADSEAHDRIMLGGHFPDRVRCDTWSVDSIPLLNIGKRSTQEELHRVSGVVATYRGTRNQNPGSATCARVWSTSTRPTLRRRRSAATLRRWAFTQTGGLAAFISSTLFSPPSISCVDLDRSIAPARQPRSQPHDAKGSDSAAPQPLQDCVLPPEAHQPAAPDAQRCAHCQRAGLFLHGHRMSALSELHGLRG